MIDQVADLTAIKKEISARRLGSTVISRVSTRVKRDVSRNNLSLLWRVGPNTPLREIILEEARALLAS